MEDTAAQRTEWFMVDRKRTDCLQPFFVIFRGSMNYWSPRTDQEGASQLYRAVTPQYLKLLAMQVFVDLYLTMGYCELHKL